MMWGDMYVLFIGKSRKKKSHSKALRKRLGSPKQDGGRGKPDTAEGEIFDRCVLFLFMSDKVYAHILLNQNIMR